MDDWIDERVPFGAQRQRRLEVHVPSSRRLLLQGPHAGVGSAGRAAAGGAGDASDILRRRPRARLLGQGQPHAAAAGSRRMEPAHGRIPQQDRNRPSDN